MRAIVISSTFAFLLAGTGSAARKPPTRLSGLVPHRAVYDLSLARSDGGSRGIDTARGRIAFDFGGMPVTATP